MMKRLLLSLALILAIPAASLAQPVFRSDSNGGDAPSAGVSAIEPAGCASGDAMIGVLYIESDTPVTAPASWSNSFNGTTMLAEANTASNQFRAYAYWIRRGGSAPDLTWGFSSAYNRIYVACYSGALATGDPFSFGTPFVKDTAVNRDFPDSNGTTTTANELIIAIENGFTLGSGTTSPVPTTAGITFTEREDAATGYGSYDGTLASAGVTGTIDSGAYTGGSNSTASVLLMGLKAAAGGGATATPGLALRGVSQ